MCQPHRPIAVKSLIGTEDSMRKQRAEINQRQDRESMVSLEKFTRRRPHMRNSCTRCIA